MIYFVPAALSIPRKTRSNRLLDNAAVAELYKLTKHPDDVIKFLAYKTLLITKDIPAYPLLKNALNDRTAFYFDYDGGHHISVSPLGAALSEELFYIHLDTNTAAPPPPPPEIRNKVSRYLSSTEIESLKELYMQKKEALFW